MPGNLEPPLTRFRATSTCQHALTGPIYGVSTRPWYVLGYHATFSYLRSLYLRELRIYSSKSILVLYRYTGENLVPSTLARSAHSCKACSGIP